MLSMGKTSKAKKTNISGCLSNSTQERKSGHDVLSICIKELSVLYSLYMPFLINGEIFIPTTKAYEIDDKVFFIIKIDRR